VNEVNLGISIWFLSAMIICLNKWWSKAQVVGKVVVVFG
jgi:hypothetical protein